MRVSAKLLHGLGSSHSVKPEQQGASSGCQRLWLAELQGGGACGGLGGKAGGGGHEGGGDGSGEGGGGEGGGDGGMHRRCVPSPVTLHAISPVGDG